MAPDRSRLSLLSAADVPSGQHARLRAMVDDYFDFVGRTLRNAGVPASDLDDEVQRTFLIASKRMEGIEAGSERSFLFSVAHNLAMRARRTLARRREVLQGDPPDGIESVATPEFFAEQRQSLQLYHEILSSLPESLRAVFTLFELEEMNMREIAATLGLPVGTVASRLRRSRQLFRRHPAAVEFGNRAPEPGAAATSEPTPLRRLRNGALQSALLASGLSVCASPSSHARTLSALGLGECPLGRG